MYGCGHELTCEVAKRGQCNGDNPSCRTWQVRNPQFRATHEAYNDIPVTKHKVLSEWVEPLSCPSDLVSQIKSESDRLGLGLRRGSEFIHPQEFRKRQESGRSISSDDILNLRILLETSGSVDEFLSFA